MLMRCGLELGVYNCYQWHTQLLPRLLGIVDHYYNFGLPADHCAVLSSLSSYRHLRLMITVRTFNLRYFKTKGQVLKMKVVRRT